jgi:hypothetical protein
VNVVASRSVEGQVRITSTGTDAMKLWHHTCLAHLGDILDTRMLTLTESNVGSPDAEGKHYAPDVTVPGRVPGSLRRVPTKRSGRSTSNTTSPTVCGTRRRPRRAARV